MAQLYKALLLWLVRLHQTVALNVNAFEFKTLEQDARQP
jgi:hypothetical protein